MLVVQQLTDAKKTQAEADQCFKDADTELQKIINAAAPAKTAAAPKK